MVRVGMIGCGGMGNAHGPVLAKLPDVRIVGTCDLIPEKAKALAEKTGVSRWCTDFRVLLPDVDAARRLVRGVSDHCRRAVDRVEPVGAGDLLPAYLEPARSGRGPLLSGVLEQMVRDSLDAIATGTGEDR